ncbi:EEF1A lysine methyltransferase 4 [Astyanax mexicanus]|uniref:EEF1A lysine methyltransferase 4 n=2 Tax=Astyanax mexicanus TaxID=7994 RepID=A0A8T2M3R9_ASTMX|nr:EEF1A lysine methyltransferase 4 [Astyanax mexicanus]KAG9278300.1 endothelin-converting enzyme 2-like [Astyanax mexicanus]
MIDMEYLPHSNAEYKDMQYWNTRYQTEESFEWFGDFSRFQHLLVQHVGRYDSILMLGCGNSALSTDMCQAGYTSITNVDYSSVCVETMAQRHSDCAGLSWVCMDIRRLAFPDASFDVVIEKGTLDAMLVDERDPWNVSDSSAHLLHQVLSEISRVLKPGGRFISVTFAQPHFRKRLYARTEYDWSINHHHYGEAFHYFLYVLTKGEELSSEDAALERRLRTEAEAPPTAVSFQDGENEDFLNNIAL